METNENKISIRDHTTWYEFFLRPKIPWWKSRPTIPAFCIPFRAEIGSQLVDFTYYDDIVPAAAETWINERLNHRYIALGLDRINDSLIETDTENLLANLVQKRNLWATQKIGNGNGNGKGPYYRYNWDPPVLEDLRPLIENVMMIRPGVQDAKSNLHRNRGRTDSTPGELG